MKCIIAEKPSVGRDLARVVGATTKGDGYIEGNGYIVTWAVGHLVNLAMPGAYGFAYRAEDLPMRPSPFRLSVLQLREGKTFRDDPKAARQLETIRACFERSDGLIVATDAGREGELIFRYIYEYLGCRKPFERLWISSLTERAIRDGLARLQPGGQYDNLYRAARARDEADWLVGMNASRALSLSRGQGVYSLGRVQTPTLGMICERYLEHRAFKRVPFWRLRAGVEVEGATLVVQSKDRFDSHAAADAALLGLQAAGQLRVVSSSVRTTRTPPPLLYDLTTLQKDANRRHGLTASQTLVAMQQLYETGICTYPRTGSRHIGDDVFERVPSLLAGLGHPMEAPNPRPVDASRVTDHHAIIVTGEDPGALEGDARLVYDLVVRRFVEAFSPDSEEERMAVELRDGERAYEWRCARQVSAGWRGVRAGEDAASADDDEEAQDDAPPEVQLAGLPELAEGATLPLGPATIAEQSTQPRPIFTESGILTAMERAGQRVEDAAGREAMSGCGLGTPATRASILETLILRGYVAREKKRLVPTKVGLEVYGLVKGQRIADVAMTGSWELSLAGIEAGQVSAEGFSAGIREYAGHICQELLALPRAEDPRCPKCGAEGLVLYEKVARCRAEGCDFHVFRNVAGRMLSDAELLALTGNGPDPSKRETPLLKGLKSRAGRSFEAYLRLNEDFTTSFRFREQRRQR